MLKHTEIKSQFNEYFDPKWLTARLPRVRAFPGADAWLQVHYADDNAIAESRKLRKAADAFRVTALSDAQRRTLVEALFPKLADTIERVWQQLPNATYAARYTWQQSPFRAPLAPAIAAHHREAFFESLISELGGADPDPVWLATWSGHVGYSGEGRATARLLAAAIDAGGPVGNEVFDILKQAASNTHDTAEMNYRVIDALLGCGRPDAWEFVCQLLRAAQRQEGLRQSILEQLTLAHPGALRRLLKLIADERLTRFASAVRAIDVWFGMLWDSMAASHAQSIVERVNTLIDDPASRAAALAGADAETAYLALWCEAAHDAESAAQMASGLLADADAAKRWVGVHVLARVCLPQSIAPLARALTDADLRVAAHALDGLASTLPIGAVDDEREKLRRDAAPKDLFDSLETLLNRVSGKKIAFKPLVFPWGRTALGSDEVGTLLVAHCPPEHGARLIAHLDRMSVRSRVMAVSLIAGHDWSEDDDDRRKATRPRLTPLARQTLITMLGDPAKDVRERVDLKLAGQAPSVEEVARHEDLLDRAAPDIRSRALRRVLSLPDPKVLESAARLLERGDKRFSAGLELLRALVEAGRATQEAIALAAKVKAQVSAVTTHDEATLGCITRKGITPNWSLDDALGLAKPFTSRPLPEIRPLPAFEPTRGAIAAIWSLDRFIDEHKLHELKRESEDVSDEPGMEHLNVLGSLTYPGYFGPRKEHSVESDRQRCPIRPLLDEWMLQRDSTTRDPDGLELLRAWVITQTIAFGHGQIDDDVWPLSIRRLTPKGCKGHPSYPGQINLFLEWVLRFKDHDPTAFFHDQLEGAISRGHLFDELARTSRFFSAPPSPWSAASLWKRLLNCCPACWSRPVHVGNLRRFEALVRAADAEAAKALTATKSQPSPAARTRLSELEASFETDLTHFIPLWEAGDISDDELLIRLTRGRYDSHYKRKRFDDFSRLNSARLPSKRRYWWQNIDVSPRLDALLDSLCRRILEIELARGDADTIATPLAVELDPSGGIDAVIPALRGLGKQNLVRGYIWRDLDKASTFSLVIRNSRPGPSDTPERFAAAAREAALTETRLVQLALYQPRWSAHVQAALGWEGLEEGVLWLRMHTRDKADAESFRDEPPERWESRAAELTAIPLDRLADGAVERAWFDRCYQKLGPKRWEMLYDAAKYASGGTGHARARLFADAMLGNLTEDALITRITTKRHQDSARALGLLKLAQGQAGRDQVMARFKVLQEMRRTSRKHGGSMLQASEKRAVETGMENLAWTAGYPDPLRLQWAMEIEEFGDLARGPIVVDVGPTRVTLSVDEGGVPSLVATKGDKPLKSLPPAIKKDASVAPLVARLAELRKQGSRIRQALEQAMCRGDSFAGNELVTLFGHPLLKSLLARLVLLGTTRSGAPLIGYPDQGGRVLRNTAGHAEPIAQDDVLRVAHPLDLLETHRWHEWQRECFAAERVQPFKQIFREVYTPIDSEIAQSDGTPCSGTRRYAGQQVQPRQALALFGSRGWVARPEEGVQLTFHHERLTVHVAFQESFYTPAEIDGLTIDGLRFHKAGTDTPVANRDVPPRVFSEVMRDLDLVVSVAHRGGVDPEASHSTVEMRASLLRETCSVLALSNVSITENRAIIRGERGEYLVHLGSGNIHMMPGGAIWVVPVHSQHRGRVFLPFADDDPKSAEVLSKVLLLARDREIQDPSILAQINSR